MKTSLTKSLGLEEIDWKDIFTKGLNKKLTDEELKSYIKKLEKWETCPCGHLSKHLPRNELNEPLCPIMIELGSQVLDTISLTDNEREEGIEPNFANALNLMQMMQLREKFLLQEVKEELEEKIATNTKQLLADKKMLKAVSA